MTDRIYNVLFLCTGNSARSVLGEAIMNAVPGGKFRAYSAGSQPKGQVNPLTLHTLKEMGLPTEGYRSKSWDLPRRTRRNSISSSPSVTTRPGKPALTGQASR